jgi:hypothetical protein
MMDIPLKLAEREMMLEGTPGALSKSEVKELDAIKDYFGDMDLEG